MQKLIAELRRLFLSNDRRYDDAALERHLRGEHTMQVDLAGDGFGCLGGRAFF